MFGKYGDSSCQRLISFEFLVSCHAVDLIYLDCFVQNYSRYYFRSASSGLFGDVDCRTLCPCGLAIAHPSWRIRFLRSDRDRSRERTDPGDIAGFIEANLHVLPVPSVPEINLYTAHPGSGLRWLLGEADEDGPPPYWAYRWAGGTVLARYILDHPETVSGKRVLDLGAGSGIVGIAAMKAGAANVVAADIDRFAIIAMELNAALNAVELEPRLDDLTTGLPPDVDVVAVGDLFYEKALALRVAVFLDRCLSAGLSVLVGDPGRAHLPLARLRTLAEYPITDFGEARRESQRPSAVFAFSGS